MLLACFTPIDTYYPCTMLCFDAFSETNLLTRCHSVSSMFSAVFGFRKVIKEIFSELDETKAKPSSFPACSRSPKGSQRNVEGRPHQGQAWATHWPRLGMVSSPWHSPTFPLRLFKHILGKTQDTRASIHEKFRSRRHRQP